VSVLILRNTDALDSLGILVIQHLGLSVSLLEYGRSTEISMQSTRLRESLQHVRVELMRCCFFFVMRSEWESARSAVRG